MEDEKALIHGFLTKSIRNHNLKNDDRIFDQGFVNSLFALKLVLFIESTFGITVENEDLDLTNFASVDAIADFIGRKRS